MTSPLKSVCIARARSAISLAALLALSTGAATVIKPLQVPASGKTGFTKLTPLNFTNHLSDETVQRNRIYELGSGVALGDFDNDGFCDIFLPRLEGDNVLYRNLGNWRFEAVDSPALACPGEYSTGAVFADIDNDLDLDLLVTGIGHGTRLFLNNGKGQFGFAANSGLERRFGATSMTLADIDGDGDLDLYVCNYRTTTIKDNPNEARPEARQVGDKIVVTPADRFEALAPKGGGVILIEKGEPDIFYRNEGNGRFTAISWTGGAFLDENGGPLTSPPRDWGLSAMFRDIDGDGLPDLYVCNDFFQSPDRIWINQGRGVFRLSNTTTRTMSMSSMSVDFSDINRDGHDDFFVADMLSPRNEARQRQRANVLEGDLQLPYSDPNHHPEVARNTLFLNRGDGTYAEIGQLAGLDATEWTWSSTFMDVDLDGFEDLLLSTGNNHDVLDSDSLRAMQTSPAARAQGIRTFPRLELTSFAFRNNSDLTFTNMSAAWGFTEPAIAHGMAAADLDNDGDLDLVVNRLNSPAALYRNNSTAPRVLVRALIGARVIVGKQSQVIQSGGRYLSGDAQERMFAAAEKNEIRVEFPDNKTVVLTNVPADSLCIVDPIEAKPGTKSPEMAQPFFTKLKEIPAEILRALENSTKPPPALKEVGMSLGVVGPIALLPARATLKLATGAASVDIDGDNDQDLIVTREWESPFLFINENGAYKDASANWGLTNMTGWWTSVAIADFNNDKRPDFILGNWGRNTKYEWRRPIKAFYGDLNSDGVIDVIETWSENGRYVPVRDLDTLAQIIPDLRERFPTYRAFGEAAIEQILNIADTKVVVANSLETTIFLNRGYKFERGRLPVEAQFSPVLSIASGDFNKDGHEDIFLGQNFLQGDQENARHDAGMGLVLINNGDATFRALSPQQSGVRLFGETRAAIFQNGILATRENFFKLRDR